MGKTANNHATHDVWVDHGAAIVADDVFENFHMSSAWVNFHVRNVRLERKTGINLDTLGLIRQLPAAGHLEHMMRL